MNFFLSIAFWVATLTLNASTNLGITDALKCAYARVMHGKTNGASTHIKEICDQNESDTNERGYVFHCEDEPFTISTPLLIKLKQVTGESMVPVAILTLQTATSETFLQYKRGFANHLEYDEDWSRLALWPRGGHHTRLAALAQLIGYTHRGSFCETHVGPLLSIPYQAHARDIDNGDFSWIINVSGKQVEKNPYLIKQQCEQKAPFLPLQNAVAAVCLYAYAHEKSANATTVLHKEGSKELNPAVDSMLCHLVGANKTGNFEHMLFPPRILGKFAQDDAIRHGKKSAAEAKKIGHDVTLACRVWNNNSPEKENFINRN
jgi:hypothetical protein